jgi:hypothetical protein
MFTVDELMKKVPEMLKDVKMPAPTVKPSEAQQYVKSR